MQKTMMKRCIFFFEEAKKETDSEYVGFSSVDIGFLGWFQFWIGNYFHMLENWDQMF